MGWILDRLIPMQRVGHAFMDRVSGKPVDYYRERRGRIVMAEGPWAQFRVPARRTGQGGGDE